VHGDQAHVPAHPRISVGGGDGAGLVAGGKEPDTAGDQRVGDLEVAAADHPEAALHAQLGQHLAYGLGDPHAPKPTCGCGLEATCASAS